jgi:hypothetical protein
MLVRLSEPELWVTPQISSDYSWYPAYYYYPMLAQVTPEELRKAREETLGTLSFRVAEALITIRNELRKDFDTLIAEGKISALPLVEGEPPPAETISKFIESLGLEETIEQVANQLLRMIEAKPKTASAVIRAFFDVIGNTKLDIYPADEPKPAPEVEEGITYVLVERPVSFEDLPLRALLLNPPAAPPKQPAAPPALAPLAIPAGLLALIMLFTR